MTTYVLGVGFSHDASGVILRDGLPIVGIIQLERITRVRYDSDFSQLPYLVDYLLDSAGISFSEIYAVGEYIPYIHDLDMLKVSSLDLGAARVFLHVNHHLAHACSAFAPSGFGDATVLVVDGNGDPHFDSLDDWILEGPELKHKLSRTLHPADYEMAPRYETESIYEFRRDDYGLLERRTMKFGRRVSSTGRWADALGIGLHHGEVASILFGSMHAAGTVMA